MPGPSACCTIVRRVLVVLLVLGAAALAWLLLYGGRFLQHEDPLEHADAIFVLAGSRLERPLEGADLYKAGWAPRIVLSPGYVEPAERLARANGIVFASYSDFVKNAFVQLGVPAPVIITDDSSLDNTASEANLLRKMVIAHHWTRIIIVTSKYHTRRSRFAFRRGLEGTGAKAIVHASRYDTSDPAHWWHRRPDVREAGHEWVGLILYWCGLAA